jgi:uncharacterized protein
MKIDIFPHIMPPKFFEKFKKVVKSEIHTILLENNATLWNLEKRFQVMDKFDDYVQVLTMASPALENIADPKMAVDLSRMANDELSELYHKNPDRFAAAVGCLPMNDMDAALKELDRCIKDLHLRGVQIFTPTLDKPLDSPEYMPLYEKMSYYNLPIWIHPQREPSYADYKTEKASKYDLFSLFGWVYETTAFMARLVMSGVLEKYPNLKIITHHGGAMVPFLENRITGFLGGAELAIHKKTTEDLRKPVIDYFKMFYADTAIYGHTPGLMLSHNFYGPEHLMFGTDMPYDPTFGLKYVKATIEAIEEMDISKAEKKMIFEGNARKLLRLAV